MASTLPYGWAEDRPRVTSELRLALQESEASGETRLSRSVSIDQAAQLLNVSRRTIYNRIRDGRLQTIRTLGGSQRVLIESLHDLGFRPQAFSASAAAASFTVRTSTRS